MRRVLSCVVACIACTATAPYTPASSYTSAPSYTPASSTAKATAPARSADAVAAFDGLPNGLVDLPTHRSDQAAFDRQEEISSGLGPLYNAHSCRDCHENPVAGGGGQTTEPPPMRTCGKTNSPCALRWPARSSPTWLPPPATGFSWQSRQECAL